MARSDKWLFLNQQKYALDIISEAGLSACKPVTTPLEPRNNLALSKAPLLNDHSSYRRLVGQLNYLTVTRFDLAYTVHILSQFLQTPTEEHLQAAYRVLRYLKNAHAQGLFYPANATLQLTAFCDADWGSCPLARRSIIGFAINFRSSLIS